MTRDWENTSNSCSQSPSKGKMGENGDILLSSKSTMSPFLLCVSVRRALRRPRGALPWTTGTTRNTGFRTRNVEHFYAASVVHFYSG